MKFYKWKEKGKLKIREYKDYNEYISHQAYKLERSLDNNGEIKRSWLKNYDDKYCKVLEERLREDNLNLQGKNVLCLAARIGTEVRAFKQLGCFAVGIDIEPGIKNNHVLYGDFHDMQFPDKSVDVIFTNSLDHSWNIEKLISEIKRVLKQDGLLILEIARIEKAFESDSYFEALIWENVDDVLELFKDFKIIKREKFKYPWTGEHIILCLI